MNFDNDDMNVFFGRGGAVNSHPGNIREREIVMQYVPRYIQAQRNEKRQVAEEVQEEISLYVTDDLEIIQVQFLIQRFPFGPYEEALLWCCLTFFK